MNIFINHLIGQKDGIKGYKHHKRYKNFIKKLKGSSPDFGTLWQISDFIKYLEILYFYNNNPNQQIYSSINYKPENNGFKITTDEIKLICKLYSNKNEAVIEIERLNGHKLKNIFTFVNNNWVSEDVDEFDEILLNNIISIIWKHVIMLMDLYYYKIDSYGGYEG